MGKRQHQKDKLYLTCTEWSHLYGGRRPDADVKDEISLKFRRLPFDQCSLSLQPFTHPYCTPDGYLFDLANIIPFLKKYAINPINGEKMDAKCLIKLNFHRSNDGSYHCPVLFKVFNENSHIVAIRTTGNVYSYEAVEQLNYKTKNMRDLLTDEPFTKKDVIVIQEPLDVDKRNAANFYHVKHKLKWTEEEEVADNPYRKIKTLDHITRSTLEELNKDSTSSMSKPRAEEGENKDVVKRDQFNTAIYSTGKVSASFTSTAMDRVTTLEPETLTNDEVRYSRVKGKAYVQLQTNFGPLNFELYCHEVKLACDNFIQLCKKGYYDGTKFHRLIKHFMIQGGDPTGTGKGGSSVWDKPFKDEFRGNLTHTGRGILSMANSGPNTNKSQFFITFRSCNYLDRKHTVFGKLVGGFEALNKIEKVPTDKKDKPLEEIVLSRAVVFVDPFQEVDDFIMAERARIKEEQESRLKKESEAKAATPSKPKQFRQGVGSLIDPSLLQNSNLDDGESSVKSKKVAGRTTFGDFSSW